MHLEVVAGVSGLGWERYGGLRDGCMRYVGIRYEESNYEGWRYVGINKAGRALVTRGA